MENFRTEIKLKKSTDTISYKSKIALIGSCFTENIGKQLENWKFNIDINPFGIIYNPYSVYNSLEALIENKKFTKDDLNFSNGLWNSFYHHGKFSNQDENITLSDINSGIEKSNNFYKEADYLFITFGTAWIYRFKDTNQVVSNCHKIPAKEFNRELLTVSEIVDLYKGLITDISEFNPNLKIVFTVSPVRHWKDGAVQNQISKSTLILAINELTNHFSTVSYFPSYEIVMDDLRDYRFYNEDMLHPNSVAVKYIRDKFTDMYIEEATIKSIKEIEKIIRASEHRPFNPHTDEHQLFVKKQLELIKSLNITNSDIDFGNEIETFNNQLL